jgi:hypothetical protein
MDFDVVDDSRPRFQLQSGPSVVSDDKDEDRRKLSKVQIGVCVGVALLLLSFAWMQSGLVQFLAGWLALALLVGPFAPSSATGGDCRVGMGGLVPEDTTLETTLAAAAEATERRGQKGYGSRKRVANAAADRGGGGGVSSSREGSLMMVDEHHGFQKDAKEEEQQQEPGLGFRVAPHLNAAAKDEEVEKAWSGDEIELLKKQLLKHPRGTLQRWEVIAEALGGAHRVESVIKMSKLLGDKKFSDGDSYANFLAQRKSSSTDKGIIIDSPLSQRSWEITTPKTHNIAADLDTKSPTTSKGSKPKDGSNRSTARSNAAAVAAAEEITKAVTRSDWTEGEDKALLSALKVFPKDSAMRWDKVAEAMPGRSKAQCFRRFSDLRETFRSAKTDSGNPGSSDQVVE